MKKIFTLCLAGALALAATACDDDDDKDGGYSGKMTVSGQTEEVKSALYYEYAADGGDEAEIDLYLFKDALSAMPNAEPSFYVNLEISESLNGKTVDLTKPIVKSGTLAPYLDIVAANEGQSFEIDNSEGSIDISVGEADTSLTVTSGTLKVTKNGGDFSVKLSVKLSDGKSIFADWTGKATKVTIPE